MVRRLKQMDQLVTTGTLREAVVSSQLISMSYPGYVLVNGWLRCQATVQACVRNHAKVASTGSVHFLLTGRAYEVR